IKRKAHVKQSFSLDFLERGTFTEYPFVEKNPGLHGIRFSMSDYRQQEWLTNYPLYSVGYIF
ncbi:hypothetical protein, partial [Bacteroides ovatus]|uniref:hypothetical protein n=1 Tax=Bacteroides ovatus TaxID=28116 RepID=UPI0039B58C4A